MKRIMFILALLCLEKALHAQYVYTIKADSVKITNTCDTAELIIENHTQNVCGFLFNKGRGRTEFRRGLIRINDSISIIGCDTLKMNPWLQGGNRFGTIGKFGTLDENPIDYYTNNTLRGRWATNGNLIIGNSVDEGSKLQVKGTAGIFVDPNLSREGDRIKIGGYNNLGDGQNIIFSTSNDYGATYKNILTERDGHIGIGVNGPYAWNGGKPTIRCYNNGDISFMPNALYFGNVNGPWNSSALVTTVSHRDEWLTGENEYPADQYYYYYFGTVLNGAHNGKKRAPLWITGRDLLFKTGGMDATSVKIAENRNVMIGTETDNGDKLQVIGNVFANGNQHRIGNLAIVYGNDVGASGFATGIRIDNTTNGSFILQGTNQGWANDMFTFTDAYGGIGQDIYNPEQSIVKIASGVRSNNTAGNSANILNIQPNYNLNLAISNPLIMRGIYYKPTLTSIVPGSKHIAIETVTGDVLLGTTSGNTGIGTNAPTAQLHTTGTVRFGGLTNDNSLSRIVVSDATGNLYYRDASSLVLNETMNSDLAINGRVSANQILITQTGRWPDYVFSKQYQLPSLTEVENFINQNSHLPGVPSAAEVEKKGIDVGSNQAALLKKIEELTLYIIEQDKTIKKQNDKINDLLHLKQEMAELKALIKNM